MRAFVYMTVVTACLGALALTSLPQTAQADEYWDGYWGWYDGSYRPYYYRQYSAPPRYGYGYGYAYPAYPYDGYYYGRPRYYGNYYGTPNFGYRDYRGGGQVRVGPMQFGWR